MPARRLPAVIFVLGCSAAFGPAGAQAAPPWARAAGATPNTAAAADLQARYGGTAVTTVTSSAWDFGLAFGTEGSPDLTLGRTCLAATDACVWAAGVRVPTGALIRSVEASFCDNDATGHVEFALLRTDKVPSTSVVPLVEWGSEIATTPGCTSLSVDLPVAEIVDNEAHIYQLGVAIQEPATNVNWNQLRVRYALQVSAAPTVATFADVPTTHPFFRFVEALAASGITGGCGPSSYCPDTPLTRGQMAVFLASALGLHFPN